MAENINNVKQIKLALESFAMDFNGHYPDEVLHERLGTSGTSSNALLRQLFVTKDAQSELIFWAKDSAVCSLRPPPGRRGNSTRSDPSGRLKPGANHWAYFHGLSNDAKQDSPILVESFQPDAERFDPSHNHRMAIMVRVDSSARAHRVTPEGRLRNDDGLDFLSLESGYASQDLRQPEPARK